MHDAHIGIHAVCGYALFITNYYKTISLLFRLNLRILLGQVKGNDTAQFIYTVSKINSMGFLM